MTMARPNRSSRSAAGGAQPLAARRDCVLVVRDRELFLFPNYLVLISQILVAGLFALSLDLMLGYGGMPSLGHAAFFGLGPMQRDFWGRWGGVSRSRDCYCPVPRPVFSACCAAFFERLRTTAFLMVTLTLACCCANSPIGGRG